MNDNNFFQVTNKKNIIYFSETLDHFFEINWNNCVLINQTLSFWIFISFSNFLYTPDDKASVNE